MGELEDRIGSLLSDPEQLAQLRAMAQSIMGGLSPEASAEGGAAAPKDNAAPQEKIFQSDNAAPQEKIFQSDNAASLGKFFQSGNAASLGKIGALLRGGPGGGNPRLAALEALAPCLGEKRREKLARAMRLARVLRLAQAGLLSAEGRDV